MALSAYIPLMVNRVRDNLGVNCATAFPDIVCYSVNGGEHTKVINVIIP